MESVPKLHEYLLGLDFMNAKSSKEYIGTKTTNPAMFLEDSVPAWSRMSRLDELSAALAVFKEKVCIPEFPARFSPPFWLAQAALQTIYKVLNSYLLNNFSEEVSFEVNNLLFDVWVHLIEAGPGSSHLEMMDIILKNQHFLLWKYMETLTGDNLKLLIATLKTDFVYEEDVSSVHYATLMETHIDKIFRSILAPEQFQEAQRGFLDLHLYYLGRMNHVPPHIGPRLSHLCFLICQKYEQENPYLGLDDWVLMRHHLKTIKDVVTDWTFTVASEAQYRAPITLEKIFQAAIMDNMLEVLFKDFMALLVTICNHRNSKKCKRLFAAYQMGLFQQIDTDNMEVQPEWMFDQCVITMAQVASTNAIESPIEHMIIEAEQDCLLKLTDLTGDKKDKWHKLLENYVVSGRCLLVREAARLLETSVLLDCGVLNWKEHLSQARMLIDIISDLPRSFLQDDNDSSLTKTTEAYVTFFVTLISQLQSQELVPRVQENFHKCVIRCLSKDPLIKARIAAVCTQENVVDFEDLNFLREMLFCVDKLLKDDDCLTVSETLSSVVESLLANCVDTFREKRYIPVDYNTLLMSICLTCISGDGFIQTDKTGPPYDIYLLLYNSVVLQFIRMHQTHGTLHLVSSIVPQVIQQVQEGIQQGTSIARCANFLQWLGTSCPEVITGHCPEVMELFLDWECYSQIYPLLPVLYPIDPLSVLRRFPVMFEKLKSASQSDRQTILSVLRLVVENHAELFSAENINQLVSMYRQETQTSQQLILEIIHRVALHSPGVVFGFYTHLTDDTKFPVASLKDRAPILATMAQNNEELAKKTTDYLMTHVINKDSAVSLVAMETLEPLLKQSHSCLLKHKPKLRTLAKTSSCPRVKEICQELLPDMQNKGPKTVQKENKPIVKEPESHKSSVSKRSDIRNKASKSRKTSTENQPPVKVVSIKQTDIKDLEHEVFMKDNGENSDTEMIVSEVTNNNTDNEKVGLLKSSPRRDAFVAKVTENSIKADHKLENVDTEYLDKDDEIVSDKCHSDVNFVSAVNPCQSNKDNLINVHGDGKDLEEAKECLESPKLTENTNYIDNNVEKDVSGFEMESPPVYLSFHKSCTGQVSMLRRHLKMAGYDCWADTGQTGSGDREMHTGIHGAKVVIICLTEKFLSSSECCSEVSSAFQLSKPVIPLAVEMLSAPPTSLLKNHLAIRFYTKPGEVKVTMGFWVEHKFQELLMQLNYLRILPDEKLITKAYENWWLPKQQPSNKEKVDASPVSESCFPNVFISYNWGKQHQVINLYEQLTDLGYGCWLGVYQMSGSESLYNKITQGLHGCRVMVACVTKKYTRAENCQQEVRLAHSLKRPIIPLLLEEVIWPLEGDIGKVLEHYDCIKLDKRQHGEKKFHNDQFEKLVEKLCLHVPNTALKEKKSSLPNRKCEKDKLKKDKHESENTLKEKAFTGDSAESKMATKKVSSELISDSGRTLKVRKPPAEKHDEYSRHAMHKSSSMFEIEKVSDVMVASSNRNVLSKTDDDLIVKKSLPEGVIVDEMGYTVRSSRSKSCVIL